LQFFDRCNHDPATTVLAHLPSPVSGMGTKSDDFHAVFACNACHAALDQHDYDAREIEGYVLNAIRRTQKFWFENGYLIIAGDKGDKPKPRSTKELPPRRPIYRRG
jgi:Protein of unknown function (DUF1364)